MYPGLDDNHNGVLLFLQNLGLEKYWDIFKAKGYDRESDVLELDEYDIESMHIEEEDGNAILVSARKFRVSSSFVLQCWLEENGLAHYHDNLIRWEVTELSQLEHLEVDESVFSELEMDVPGHRKRFIKALNQLRKRQKLSESDEPLTEGYWGKPEALVEPKNDFLCLKADIISTNDSNKSASLEFMVDSGSDVVTVRQEILDMLDLELMGTIQSQGVHASKRKEIFKGIIRIGGVDVDTEVMSETYDSIGNQVIRNFRHVIDSHKHYWYESNHRFSPPSDLTPFNLRPDDSQEGPQESDENMNTSQSSSSGPADECSSPVVVTADEQVSEEASPTAPKVTS